VLHGLHRFYFVLGELQTALELGEQILRLAQRQDAPALRVPAHRVLGATWYYLGEFAAAQEHLEQGLALYDRQQHHTYVLLYGQDEGVACLSYVALALWCLGYPDQALKRIHEALTLAQELSHPFSLVYALSSAAHLHLYRREGQVTQERVEAAMTLATGQGFAFWVAHGTILRGWVLAAQGQGEEGIAQMRQGLAAYRATGAEVGRPYWLAQLAGVSGKAGQAEEGLSVLAEALALVETTGERRGEAELYRFRGELLLMQGGRGGSRTAPTDEAEVCFRQAIEVARRQQAKLLELRATVSLCRLLQSQGRGEEGRQILAEVYGWFTEGFDTPDLREANALLDALS
jgi:predicted ATPase